MPPKAEKQRKEKKVEELTFGLKNKSKSKKVQKFVSTVRTQIHGGGGRKTVDPNEARRLKREQDKARQEELLRLFRPAETEKDRLAREEAEKRRAEAAAEDSDADESGSEASDDSEEEVKTLEEVVDEERSKLVDGNQTVLTEELFFKWKAENDLKRAAEQRAKDKEGGPKKKGLTGRELFATNAAMFVDDDAGVDVYEKDAHPEWDEEQQLEEANLDEFELDDTLLETEAALEEMSLHESLPATFDQDTWKDTTRMPKSMLLEYLQSLKKGGPKFERQQFGHEFQISVLLPDDPIFTRREFTTIKNYPSVKTGEHAASLMALHYLYCTLGPVADSN
eukprot:ANDGO_06782.mRNA.1 hypothetical protein